ncbi:hypothetical protein HN698_00160 [Candidatus Woesearchaeota archaeon]|jgi:DNA-directed RNA polymerase specialized sigma24 family protein|nr:hypothetical protein [Candidatus Woesearchaeota archaeon]MBT4698175.1 hypothetical protein [Candidatus Woesearchaeota archaeon]MBT4717603.1 hypothetical protein [Candidatus Woesearchaeota archaeon]MBT7930314.1 hypothetical protein [Candidatus Woesearchaeota archaeon]
MATRIRLKKRVDSSAKSKADKPLSVDHEPVSKKNLDKVELPMQPPSAHTQQAAVYPSDSLSLLKSLMNLMKEQQDLTLQDTIDLYKGAQTESKQAIPLSIFSSALSPLESLCRYLKDYSGLTYRQIAHLINRDERGIWTTYQRSLKKLEGELPINKEILLPIDIFKVRNLSVLEALVKYLVDSYGYTAYKVAKLLNKNPSALTTVYKRVLEKEGDLSSE